MDPKFNQNAILQKLNQKEQDKLAEFERKMTKLLKK